MNQINLEDTKKALASTFSSQAKNIQIWAGFITMSLLVYYFLSSGDFSFLLTYASLMRCFGFALLNYKIWTAKSVSGVSVKTMELYLVSFIMRLLSIFRHQGYLPFDKTGDWFYHIVELISLACVCLVLYGVFGPLISTYSEKHDRFGNLHVPSELGALYVLVPCVVLALLFHPNLNREFFSDTCWTLSMYVEAVAMLPQLYMFQRQASDEGGTIEPMIGHTMFAVGASRIFELVFWLGSFRELADHAGGRYPGYIVLLSQIGHLIIMADFFYYYFKSMARGLPMELPASYASYV